MAMIKGITVTLIENIESSLDAFYEQIFIDKAVKVDNVLIAPASSTDIVNAQDLYGKKAVYTLAIPKSDTHDWENKEVIFFGKKWKTFGLPIEGMSENIPLDWNKKVMVERYE